MSADKDLYQSFILRMWRESAEGEWRASLQDIPSCEVHQFSTLDALMQYLGDAAALAISGKSWHIRLQSLHQE